MQNKKNSIKVGVNEHNQKAVDSVAQKSQTIFHQYR